MSCTSCGKKSVFQQAKNIVTGVVNLVENDPEVEALAATRLAKCIQCPYVRELIKVAGNSVIQCTKCMCLCQVKARVKEEECPLLLW